jgi:hypothetical protein
LEASSKRKQVISKQSTATTKKYMRVDENTNGRNEKSTSSAIGRIRLL